MTPDWILVVGTLIFFVTTWATINFGYAVFRELGAQDGAEAEQPAPTAEPAPTQQRRPTGTSTDPSEPVGSARMEDHAEETTPLSRF